MSLNPNGRLETLEKRMDKLETDLHTVKNSMQVITGDIRTMREQMQTFDTIADDISKIYTWIKRGLPLVATAAVTSGIVSGKWGAFIQALFH